MGADTWALVTEQRNVQPSTTAILNRVSTATGIRDYNMKHPSRDKEYTYIFVTRTSAYNTHTSYVHV